MVMRGGGCPGHSHAPPRSIPDRRARVDSSGALISVGRVLCPLTRRNRLSARSRPATHHRRRISPSRQRLTRAVTRRVTARADSMGWVVASVRRNARSPGAGDLPAAAGVRGAGRGPPGGPDPPRHQAGQPLRRPARGAVRLREAAGLRPGQADGRPAGGRAEPRRRDHRLVAVDGAGAGRRRAASGRPQRPRCPGRRGLLPPDRPGAVRGAGVLQVLIAHARGPVVPPSRLRPGVPGDLERVVLRCLAKDPADRFPDAAAPERALAGCADAGAWDAEQAARWWREVEPGPRPSERSRSGPDGPDRATPSFLTPVPTTAPTIRPMSRRCAPTATVGATTPSTPGPSTAKWPGGCGTGRLRSAFKPHEVRRCEKSSQVAYPRPCNDPGSRQRSEHKA